MTRAVWDELNARPLTPAPVWARRAARFVEPITPPERIGKTRRLQSEPPCAVCGNRSVWRCECESQGESGSAQEAPDNNHGN